DLERSPDRFNDYYCRYGCCQTNLNVTKDVKFNTCKTFTIPVSLTFLVNTPKMTTTAAYPVAFFVSLFSPSE
ncbi:MAG: hypothetical protein O3B18_02290, partial [Proteobacteria bacterium]|nr:hypothetical protein [Pseudomonadota bacterium]